MTEKKNVDEFLTWSDEKIKRFRKTLLTWYDEHGRVLPWRENQDPYRVLVSEVMLQQTQVNTVVPYFNRFMAALPTVQALAHAPESQVLKLWEGLGYYSRARNLQKAAQQIVDDLNGQWPKTAAGLQILSGVGPYTAGAVASIAFNEPVPAVDGNAFRVFSRLFEIDLDISEPRTKQVFTELIQRLIDPVRPGNFNQAIMDIGASYMTTKNSDPEHSPIKAFDASYLHGTVEQFPVKKRRVKQQKISYYALGIHSNKGWLFRQRKGQEMLAGLWMMPLIKREQLGDKRAVKKGIEQVFYDQTGLQINVQATNKVVQHIFTHQKWDIKLYTATIHGGALATSDNYRWLKDEEVGQFALPKVQQKINDELQIE